MVPEGNMEHWEWRKAAEMITIWVTVIQYFSINFYKLYTMVKSKNYNNVFWDFQYILDVTKAAIRRILITLNACIEKVERLQSRLQPKKLQKAEWGKCKAIRRKEITTDKIFKMLKRGRK